MPFQQQLRVSVLKASAIIKSIVVSDIELGKKELLTKGTKRAIGPLRSLKTQKQVAMVSFKTD